MSGKVYEYIKSGKPIIAIGAENDATKLLKELGLLLYRADNSIESITEMLNALVAGNLQLKPVENYEQQIELCQRKYQANQLLKLLN